MINKKIRVNINTSFCSIKISVYHHILPLQAQKYVCAENSDVCKV